MKISFFTFKFLTNLLTVKENSFLKYFFVVKQKNYVRLIRIQQPENKTKYAINSEQPR